MHLEFDLGKKDIFLLFSIYDKNITIFNTTTLQLNYNWLSFCCCLFTISSLFVLSPHFSSEFL